MDSSGSRLAKIIEMKSKNLTKFCSDYGFKKSTVSNYVNGRKMDSEFIVALHALLKISPTWLLTGEGEMLVPKKEKDIDDEIIKQHDDGFGAIKKKDEPPSEEVMEQRAGYLKGLQNPGEGKVEKSEKLLRIVRKILTVDEYDLVMAYRNRDSERALEIIANIMEPL